MRLCRGSWGILLLSLFILGCGQRDYKTVGFDEGWTLEERQKAKSFMTIKMMPNGSVPDTTSDHITNVPMSLAISKGFQALAAYNHKDAASIGFSYPLSTVWQPEEYTRQIVDGHTYWIALLGFHGENQAAYKQAGGVCPGIVVVDAEDETRPAQIRVRNNLGEPYKIKLHYRNVNWDPNYIYRWLQDHSGLQVDTWTFGGLGASDYQHYIDDVTPEVEDGTWNVYFTASYNVNQYDWAQTLGPKNWHMPIVTKVITVNASTTELKEYTPKEAPAWIDRIYSEQVVVQYINAWGYDPHENYNRTSQKNKFVLDENHLDVVMDEAGKELVYVGVVTSAMHDNSSLGVMIVPTRDVSRSKFYPCYGEAAMATRGQAVQVINDALKWRGAYVEDLTLHHLYDRPTWEGTLVMPIWFKMQEHGTSEEDEGEEDDKKKGIKGATYFATVLLAATSDMNVGDVVYDEVKQRAFDLYEHHLFVRQSSNVGARSLSEMEAEGTIDQIDHYSERGQPMFLFTLNGPKYKGLYFRLVVESTFDRDSVDIFQAQVGDRVTFRYGDDKTSPTCFVKRFRSLSRPIWRSRAGEVLP